MWHHGYLMQVANWLTSGRLVRGAAPSPAPGVVPSSLPVHLKVLLEPVCPVLLLGFLPSLHLGFQLCPAMLLN